MNTRSSPALSNVMAVTTAPRPTPVPPRVQFSDVLASGASALVQGAQAAAAVLPGSPLMAVALRGSTPSWSIASSPSIGVSPMGTGMGLGSGTGMSPAAGAGTMPEGPGGVTPSMAGSSSTGSDPSLESSMAQAEQQNLYYLQVQEQVNAQNRTFTALSNVIEVEHSTAKAAIGNIH
jgi:hypothetical protein